MDCLDKKITKIKELKNLIKLREEELPKCVENDKLYLKSKQDTEKELAEEKAIQIKLEKKTKEQTKKGISSAAEINFESELSEIKSVADKLKSNTISPGVYKAVEDGVSSRALSKKSPKLNPPPKLTEAENDAWIRQQKKIIGEKYENFLKELETIQKSLDEESAKHRRKLDKMKDEAYKSLHEPTDADTYYIQLLDKLKAQISRTGVSHIIDISNLTYSLPSHTGEFKDKAEKEKYIKKIKEYLKKDIENMTFVEEAESKYSSYLKGLIEKYNQKVTEINEYVEKNLQILSFGRSQIHYTIFVDGKEYKTYKDITRYPPGSLRKEIKGYGFKFISVREMEESVRIHILNVERDFQLHSKIKKEQEDAQIGRLKEKEKEKKLEKEILKTDLGKYLQKVTSIKNKFQQVYNRRSKDLLTDPNTASYFTKEGRKSYFDSTKLFTECAEVLTIKKDYENFYFTDINRKFTPDKTVLELRDKITKEQSEIYHMANDVTAVSVLPWKEDEKIESQKKSTEEVIEIKGVQIQDINWNYIDGVLKLTKDELIDGYVEIKGRTGKGFGNFYDNGKPIGTTKLEINTGVRWQEIKWVEGSAALDPWIFRFIPAIGENRISIRAVNPGNIYSDPMDFPPIKLIYDPTSRQSKIEEILNKLKDTFERKDISGFMKNVSDNFYGGEDVLRDQLRRFFDATNTLRLYIVIDTFRSQKNRRFLDTHWERTLVSNATSKQYKQSGYTTFVFDIDENKLLGMKGDSIFVVLSDEKEPLAGIEEKLQEQPKEQPKPKLPSGKITMYDEYYTQKGFSFSQGVLVDLGSGEDFYWNTDGMPGTVPGGIVDLGSKDLDSITSVPTTGYIKYPDWITAKEGHSYAVKTYDGKYGIIYIETVNYNSITFTWKYQPDATTTFW